MDKYLDILECCVCFQLMSRKIIVCAGGHSLCCCCSDRILECPCCKLPMTKTRNHLLESLVKCYLQDPEIFNKVAELKNSEQSEPSHNEVPARRRSTRLSTRTTF